MGTTGEMISSAFCAVDKVLSFLYFYWKQAIRPSGRRYKKLLFCFGEGKGVPKIAYLVRVGKSVKTNCSITILVSVFIHFSDISPRLIYKTQTHFLNVSIGSRLIDASLAIMRHILRSNVKINSSSYCIAEIVQRRYNRLIILFSSLKECSRLF